MQLAAAEQLCAQLDIGLEFGQFCERELWVVNGCRKGVELGVGYWVL